MSRYRTLSVPLCLMLLFSGCGSPHQSSATGKVTLDGKPLDRGTVTFHPLGEGAAAYSAIRPGGGYEIKTGSLEGLASGEYAVTVVATRPPAGAGEEVIGELITPVRYGTIEESDLRFTVTSGSNQINLELLSEP